MKNKKRPIAVTIDQFELTHKSSTYIISNNNESNKSRVNKYKDNLKRYRLRSWVRITLWLLIGAFIGIAVYQFFTIKTIHTTPVGDYTCKGGIIQVCNGSKRVATYLGV